MEIKAVAAASIEIDRDEMDTSIAKFTGKNASYYIDAFRVIQESTRLVPLSFNFAAALFGPLWAAMRGLWGFFWAFLLLEMIALVQIGRGAWGNLGGDLMERATKQLAQAQMFLDKAKDAREALQDPTRFETLAANLSRAAAKSQEAAEIIVADAQSITVFGLLLLLGVRLVQGTLANIIYEKQYSRWRIKPDQVESGARTKNILLGLFLIVAIAPLTIYKFTVSRSVEALNRFPAKKEVFVETANWLGLQIDTAALGGSGAFDSIVAVVRAVISAMSVALISTPWPVVMVVIFSVAWRAGGSRVAIFTAACMAYIAFLGYWEISMETVALVGAAVVICVMFGIPLGIWFGKSEWAYRFAEPVLDLMQTLPAFVYLIPIIAFFGTGNPPGILATIIFGMPPVIRLTALGMRGVPENIKEAANAFGASRWQLLKDVEVPLALPSIMTGVNQTILMCLSMVVIISLIGGGGLGKVILEALQYAAKGPGLLGGLAILCVAMVMDRIVQGAFRRFG